jgi:hypothetical protein
MPHRLLRQRYTLLGHCVQECTKALHTLGQAADWLKNKKQRIYATITQLPPIQWIHTQKSHCTHWITHHPRVSRFLNHPVGRWILQHKLLCLSIVYGLIIGITTPFLLALIPHVLLVPCVAGLSWLAAKTGLAFLAHHTTQIIILSILNGLTSTLKTYFGAMILLKLKEMAEWIYKKMGTLGQITPQARDSGFYLQYYPEPASCYLEEKKPERHNPPSFTHWSWPRQAKHPIQNRVYIVPEPPMIEMTPISQPTQPPQIKSAPPDAKSSIMPRFL